MRQLLFSRLASYVVVSVSCFLLGYFVRDSRGPATPAGWTLLDVKQASAGSSLHGGTAVTVQPAHAEAAAKPAATPSTSAPASMPRVNIVHSACGEVGLKQLLVALTSLYYMAQHPQREYHAYIHTDGTVQEKHMRPFKSRLTIHIHQSSPQAALLFKICSTERLYLGEHTGLQDLSNVIYADLDTMWTADPALMAEEFDAMEPGAAWALAYESDAEQPDLTTKCNWYTAGPGVELNGYKAGGGLNDGVLLAKLDVIRASNFSAERDAIIQQWGSKLILGDQDIFNIYFKYNPAQLHVLPCIMNYKLECMCALAARQLPIIIHGSADLMGRNIAEHRAYNNQYAMYEQLYQQLLQNDQIV